MSDYSKTIPLTKEIPNTKYTHLKVSLIHSHGGVNYFDNHIESAGYFLAFRPIQIVNKDGYSATTFSLFEKPELSYKINIFEKYRRAKKTEQILWDLFLSNESKIFEAWETLTPTNVMNIIKDVYSKYINSGD